MYTKKDLTTEQAEQVEKNIEEATLFINDNEIHVLSKINLYYQNRSVYLSESTGLSYLMLSLLNQGNEISKDFTDRYKIAYHTAEGIRILFTNYLEANKLINKK